MIVIIEKRDLNFGRGANYKTFDIKKKIFLIFIQSSTKDTRDGFLKKGKKREERNGQ